MQKKSLIIGLLVFVIIMTIGGVYIASRLSAPETTAPIDSSAYSYGQCPVLTSSLGTCQMPDGNCTGPICMLGVKFNLNSGASCNPGQMVNCLASGPTCAASDCGPCTPECPSGQTSVSPVGNSCPSGSNKVQGTCAGCDNPYWGCCKPSSYTNTPTPTPTRTNTPTPTNTNTPTNTPTLTPTKPITTIPQTALITDEVDRVLIGFGMVFIGILFYKNNLYYSTFFLFKNLFIEDPKKKEIEKFEKKVQDNITND
jgi:hypothetical protein